MKNYDGFFAMLPDSAAGFSFTGTSDGSYLFESWSPAGEDICVEGQLEASSPTEALYQLKADITREFENFDIDEHVDLWAEGRGENGIPNTYAELVQDAEDIERMLGELDDAVTDWKLAGSFGKRCPICGHPYLEPTNALVCGDDNVMRMATVYDCPECFMLTDEATIGEFWSLSPDERREKRRAMLDSRIKYLDKLYEDNGGDE